MNDLDIEILNLIIELYNTIKKSKRNIINIKRKTISEGNKTNWIDGCEYYLEFDNIKINAKNIINYIEPENFNNKIYKKHKVKINVKGDKKINILPILKFKIRKAKIEYVLQ